MKIGTECSKHKNKFAKSICLECLKPLCFDCHPQHQQYCGNVQNWEPFTQRLKQKTQTLTRQVKLQIERLKSENKAQRWNKDLSLVSKALIEIVIEHTTKLRLEAEKISGHQSIMTKFEGLLFDLQTKQKKLQENRISQTELKTLIHVQVDQFTKRVRDQVDSELHLEDQPLFIEPKIQQKIVSLLKDCMLFRPVRKTPIRQEIVMPVVTRHDPLNLTDLEASIENQIPLQSITAPDYFTTKQPVLHAFEPSTKNLYLIPLEKISQGFKIHITTLKVNKIRQGSKSLIVPDGSIYLIGGKNQNSSDATIGRFNLQTNTMDIVAVMKYPRSHHAITFLNDQIYIFCGETQENKPITVCQRFNTKSLIVQEIPMCRYGVSHATACSYGRYILKVGGIQPGGRIVNLIERFDTGNNRWDEIRVEFKEDVMREQFLLKTYALAVQVSENSLLVSYSEKGEEENTTAILLRQCLGGFESIDSWRLPESGYFMQPLIHKGILHSLQLKPGRLKYNIILSDLNDWKVLS